MGMSGARSKSTKVVPAVIDAPKAARPDRRGFSTDSPGIPSETKAAVTREISKIRNEDARARALAKFRRAVRKAVLMKKVTGQFRTLRDMFTDFVLDADRLRRVKLLGRGGFGTVELMFYRYDDGKEVPLAIKTLLPEAIDEAAIQDFLNEVQTLKRLDHRNIVGFKGIGTIRSGVSQGEVVESLENLSLESADIFLAQEFCEGGTLRNLIRAVELDGRKLYTFRQALRWLRDVARGMSYLHNAHPTVIHRDLKLENVLLTSKDPSKAAAKIVDFGLSKAYSRKDVLLDVRRRKILVGDSGELARKAAIQAAAGKGQHHGVHGSFRASGAAAPAIPVRVGAANAQVHQLSVVREGERASVDGTSTVEAPQADDTPVATGSMEGSDKEVAKQVAESIDAALMCQESSVQESEVPREGLGTRPEEIELERLKSRGYIPSTHKIFKEYVPVQLTGLTGSLLYMAPEVFRSEKYNEKADVFSFAVIAYELLTFKLISSHLPKADFYNCYGYAENVSKGWRPDLPKKWSRDLKQLIESAWAGQGGERPSFADIVERLTDIIEALDSPAGAQDTAGAGEKSCCVVM
ncbi:unnamed protein product [Pedinophyceae sp. YPF-701]|nr:unnamed protein product [Pedinophyceae sp. YPF-701]